MPRTEALSFRIEIALKNALEAAAREDRRSVSSLVELILVRWAEQQGHLPIDTAKRK